ncbi:hypothetical protein RND71_011656 [Anisodus tanguticus]|uniref:Uncharacterized protein n=1 Tax=Anisodus tanguticus TaxID=243964 RepID=A0AAE1SE59_9SOLA|nr:hypothetical protein RND71_011656 [Anisodus tanguticus]
MKKAERAPTCGVDLRWCQKSSMVAPTETSITSCGRTVVSKRVDGMVTRLISGIAAAFFVSLKRCSCVYVDTKHDSEDAGESCTLMITEIDVGQLQNIANPLFAEEEEHKT